MISALDDNECQRLCLWMCVCVCVCVYVCVCMCVCVCVCVRRDWRWLLLSHGHGFCDFVSDQDRLKKLSACVMSCHPDCGSWHVWRMPAVWFPAVSFTVLSRGWGCLRWTTCGSWTFQSLQIPGLMLDPILLWPRSLPCSTSPFRCSHSCRPWYHWQIARDLGKE